MKTATILGLAVIALTTGCATFPTARRNACINNMRILDAATEQTALDYNLKNGDIAPREKVSAYIMNGIDSLICPAGGIYKSGPVGKDPECSIHGTLTDATNAKIGIR